MTVDSPLSEAYVTEVLRKVWHRPHQERTAVCSSLMRQMIDAGRSRGDARRLIRRARNNLRLMRWLVWLEGPTGSRWRAEIYASSETNAKILALDGLAEGTCILSIFVLKEVA